jgi:hypothetical protein
MAPPAEPDTGTILAAAGLVVALLLFAAFIHEVGLVGLLLVFALLRLGR